MNKQIKCSSNELAAVRCRRRSFNLKYFNYGLYSLLLVLGVMYLVNINDLTIKGFALKQLSLKSASLASQQVDIEQQANNLESYYHLSSEVQKLDMVAVGKIEYLAANQGAVAKR